MLKKFLVLKVSFFILFFSTSSYSDWRFITDNIRGDKFYSDLEKAKRKDNFIYYWRLVDLIKPLSHGVFSVKSYIEVDCVSSLERTLAVYYYNDSMGDGEIVSHTNTASKWSTPKQTSTQHLFSKIMCEIVKSR